MRALSMRIWIIAGLTLSPVWGERYAVESVHDSTHSWNYDGAPALSVFLHPQDLTTDVAGNLYIIHNIGRVVVKIGADGIARRVAGGGDLIPSEGVLATEARIFARGVAVDTAGNLYVTDSSRYQIYKIGSNGRIAVFAGTGEPGYSGDGGPATKATFLAPVDLALDDASNLYVSDQYRVRVISSSGTVRTVAGTGNAGTTVDGAPATATSISVQTLAAEPSGALLLAPLRGKIYRVGTDGVIRFLSGGGANRNDTANGASADLSDIRGITAGRDGSAYITQAPGGGRVRRISATGGVTTIAGTGTAAGYGIAGDGGPPGAALLSVVGAIHADAAGTIWFADNLTVRRIASGKIETVAGSHAAEVLAGKSLASSDVQRITAVTKDRAGNLYLADSLSHSIYRATPDLKRVDRIAGTGFPGVERESGPALSTPLSSPVGVAVDAANNVYIAQSARVYRLVNGQLQAIAGSDGFDSFTENAVATSFDMRAYGMRLNTAGEPCIISDRLIFRISADGRAHTVVATDTTPAGLDFDKEGNLYFSEGNRIKKMTTSGSVTTIAGTGVAGFSGDGGQALAAQLNSPRAIQVDIEGNVLVADAVNHRVRRINSFGTIETILGGGSGFGSQWESTSVSILIYNGTFTIPGGMYVDETGTTWVVDTANVMRMTAAQIFPNWVLNAASFIRGPVAPGEVVTIYGEEIGPDALVIATYNNGFLARQVGGTQVLFDGVAAPLIYVSRTQTSVVVPYGVSGTTMMQVDYRGRKTNVIQLAVGTAMPGMFTYSGGAGPIVAVNQDYQLNSPSRPAAVGEYITVFLTGQGAVSPAIADGVLPSGPTYPSTELQIQVGGVPVPTNDLWNGLIYQGVLQVNFRIPVSAPRGSTAVGIAIAGVSSQSGATIEIR